MSEKLFPVMPSKKHTAHPLRIPWSVAEKAYSTYSKQYGNGQSLERLAERGGFSEGEMDEFHPQWRAEVSELEQLKLKLALAAECIKKFSKHKHNCAFELEYPTPCSCGYDNMLNALGIVK